MKTLLCLALLLCLNCRAELEGRERQLYEAAYISVMLEDLGAQLKVFEANAKDKNHPGHGLALKQVPYLTEQIKELRQALADQQREQRITVGEIAAARKKFELRTEAEREQKGEDDNAAFRAVLADDFKQLAADAAKNAKPLAPLDDSNLPMALMGTWKVKPSKIAGVTRESSVQHVVTPTQWKEVHKDETVTTEFRLTSAGTSKSGTMNAKDISETVYNIKLSDDGKTCWRSLARRGTRSFAPNTEVLVLEKVSDDPAALKEARNAAEQHRAFLVDKTKMLPTAVRYWSSIQNALTQSELRERDEANVRAARQMLCDDVRRDFEQLANIKLRTGLTDAEIDAEYRKQKAAVTAKASEEKAKIDTMQRLWSTLMPPKHYYQNTHPGTDDEFYLRESNKRFAEWKKDNPKGTKQEWEALNEKWKETLMR